LCHTFPNIILPILHSTYLQGMAWQAQGYLKRRQTTYLSVFHYLGRYLCLGFGKVRLSSEINILLLLLNGFPCVGKYYLR
jgi:hypothetical protein